MAKGRDGEGMTGGTVKAKVRFDYRGRAKPYRFLVGSQRADEVAVEIRDREVSLLRNVPLQGLRVLEVDTAADVYVVNDPVSGEDVAYAPVIIVVEADSIEDLVRFILREEFRKIEILEPAEMLVSHLDAERFLYRMGEEMKQVLTMTVRRLEGR